MLYRTIPSSGEQLPVIGLGTWQTFDVYNSSSIPPLHEVVDAFYKGGGSLIDSSPMYGRAEQVVGDITADRQETNDFFYATKVWTTGKQEGIRQMERSMQRMQRKNMDLMQVHNLTDWKTQLSTLRQWKEAGKIRYIGITHYTDASHEELERVLRTEKLDFVQFNYSIFSRHAEQRLLSAAAELGVATIINRPLGEGTAFQKVKGKIVPAWAMEMGMDSWAAFFLKYIISHEAVTCIIPATSNKAHALDNVGAGNGPLPNEAARKRMVEYLDQL